jgi:hypothetical protein
LRSVSSTQDELEVDWPELPPSAVDSSDDPSLEPLAVADDSDHVEPSPESVQWMVTELTTPVELLWSVVSQLEPLLPLEDDEPEVLELDDVAVLLQAVPLAVVPSLLQAKPPTVSSLVPLPL